MLDLERTPTVVNEAKEENPPMVTKEAKEENLPMVTKEAKEENPPMVTKEAKEENPPMVTKEAEVEKSPEEVSKEEIIKTLDSIDVCEICQIRIVGGGYGEHSVDETPVKEGSHCCVCLGILEGHTLTSLAKKVAEELETSDYDSPTFHIGISIPQCVILRHASVRAHLVDNGHDNIKECPTVKTVAKFFLVNLIKKLSNKESDHHSQLFIKFDFKYAGDMKEVSSLASASLASGMKRNHTKSYEKRGKMLSQYTTESVQNLVKGLSDSCIKKYSPCPPHSLQEPCDCDASTSHSSIFIGGRYNKYSRTLSQTPWFIDGVRRGDTSTLELIGGALKEFTKGDEIKLLSAGREDVDVRMLGNGRPFAVEIINPKKTVITEDEMAKLEAEINASTDLVSIHHLQIVTKGGLEIMKKGEEEKKKTYAAKLWCPKQICDASIKSLNAMKDIELKQKTPIRVLHRRPLATRLRKVYEIELKRSTELEHYELNVTTQAGTYIKELVHGDLGRTEPSLRTILGLPVDIVELDVTAVDLNWPPELNRNISKGE